MSEEWRAGGKRHRRALYVAVISGIAATIMAGGILLYIFTNQALSGYMIGLAGLVVGVIGLLMTHKVSDGPAAGSAVEAGTQVQSDLQADDIKHSEITGVDMAGSDHQHTLSRVRLGKVIGSKVTGVRFRRQ